MEIQWSHIPTVIAGGSAYWSISVNWYNESDPTKPKWFAALTITIPNEGNIIYRIAIIPRMINGPTPDVFRPIKNNYTKVNIKNISWTINEGTEPTQGRHSKD